MPVNMAQVIPSVALFILFFCIALPTFYILRRCFVALKTHHKCVSNEKCSLPPRCSQRSLLLGLDVLRNLILAVRSKRYLATIQRSYQQYGNTFSKTILFSSIICTIEPENIKAVLSTRFRDYGITDVRKDAFRPFLGENILTADGAEWRHARAMLRPSFSKNNYGDLEMFEVHVNNLLKAIRREGPVVNLKDLFLGLTADVTTHSMYGESVDSLKWGTLSRIMEAFHDAQYGCENRARWGKLALFIPQPKFYTSVKILQQYMEKHVRKGLQYSKTQKNAAPIAKTEERYVLLHELGKAIHNESRLRDELLTILFAGRDTTASLLCSLFLTVANRPDIWLRLRAEVDHLNGEKPTFEQLKKMHYSRHCLNESEFTANVHCDWLHRPRLKGKSIEDTDQYLKHSGSTLLYLTTHALPFKIPSSRSVVEARATLLYTYPPVPKLSSTRLHFTAAKTSGAKTQRSIGRSGGRKM